MDKINKIYLEDAGTRFGMTFHVTGQRPLDSRYRRQSYEGAGGILDPATWNDAEGNYKGSFATLSGLTTPLEGDPYTPVDGDVYLNTTDKKFYKYTKPTNGNGSWAEQAPIYYIYIGMPVFVNSTKAVYLYVADSITTDNITKRASWKKIPDLTDVSGGTRVIGVASDASGFTNPENGRDMYFNTTTKKFYLYVNDTWEDVTMTLPSTAEEANHASSADVLATPRHINGVEFDGSNDVTNFLVCSTAVDANENFYLNIGTINLDNGTQIKVKFTNGHNGTNPTLDASPLLHNGNPFTTWEAGQILTLTYYDDGWQVDEISGQDAILENITPVSFASVDFFNGIKDGNGVVTTLVRETDAPIGNETDEIKETLFAKMLNLAEHPDGKLHFLKFNGQRCKFEIEDYFDLQNKIIFSFVYKSWGETATMQIIRIEWSVNEIDGQNVHTYRYETKNLIGAEVDLANYATKSSVNSLANRVTILESRQQWFTLDED